MLWISLISALGSSRHWPEPWLQMEILREWCMEMLWWPIPGQDHRARRFDNFQQLVLAHVTSGSGKTIRASLLSSQRRAETFLRSVHYFKIKESTTSHPNIRTRVHKASRLICFIP